MITLEHSPVSSSPKIMGGAVVFRGTRVPVQTLVDYINDGFTLDQFLEYFPSVQQEDAKQFLLMIHESSDA